MSAEYSPNLEVINEAVAPFGVAAQRLYANTKASEYYVEVTYVQDD